MVLAKLVDDDVNRWSVVVVILVDIVVRIVVVVIRLLVLDVVSSALYNIDPINTMNNSEMQQNDENTIMNLCI